LIGSRGVLGLLGRVLINRDRDTWNAGPEIPVVTGRRCLYLGILGPQFQEFAVFGRLKKSEV
jgi:hypothetical protein